MKSTEKKNIASWTIKEIRKNFPNLSVQDLRKVLSTAYTEVGKMLKSSQEVNG